MCTVTVVNILSHIKKGLFNTPNLKNKVRKRAIIARAIFRNVLHLAQQTTSLTDYFYCKYENPFARNKDYYCLFFFQTCWQNVVSTASKLSFSKTKLKYDFRF